jgi:peptidoglycan/LPS O-acetylase OafA/YrhL
METQFAVTADGLSVRRLGYRPVLDGIRGVAIILVMLMHTDVLGNGYMGVDVFFALSGFLITTLLCEEWDRVGTISLRTFYERRARRLLPSLVMAVLACMIVALALFPMPGWSISKKTLTTLLFLNDWVAGLGHSSQLGSLSPTWSLSVEEQFYLLWPLLLSLLLGRPLAPTLIVGILVLLSALLVTAEPHVANAVHGYSRYFSPIDRAAELLFACAGAIAWRMRLIPSPERRFSRLGSAEPLARVIQRYWRTPISGTLVAAFVWLLCNHTLVDRDIYLATAAVALVLIINLLDAPTSALARLIGCPPLRYIGKISYGLYLYHMLVRDILQHYLPDRPRYFNVTVTFAASLILASISWYLLESRLRYRGRPRHQRKRVMFAEEDVRGPAGAGG